MRPILIIGILVVIVSSSFEGRAQYREDFPGGPQNISKLIHIYPNPTTDYSDFVNVRVAPLKSSKVKLTLHNIIGNEIPIDAEAMDEHELRIRVKELSSGYYLLTVKDTESNFRATYKILKR
jgi:hypothetical protein